MFVVEITTMNIPEVIERRLSQDPDRVALTDKGNPYIPIEVSRPAMNDTFGFWNWSDSNFVYNFILIANELWINGGILVTVKCGEFTKTVSGGASERVSSFTDQSIDNIVGSINSMCLSNAFRKLGRRFGSELYATEETPVEKPKDIVDAEYDALKRLLKDTPKSMAMQLLNNSKYKDVMELKNIINKK